MADLKELTAELEALLEQSSPAPWKAVIAHGRDAIWHDVEDAKYNEVINGDITATWTSGDQEDSRATTDMKLIAAMRNNLPDILERLEKVEAAARSALQIHDSCNCDDPEDPIMDSRVRCLHCQLMTALKPQGGEEKR